MVRKRGNGEGSISRRKDGRWQARYTVHKADGTSERKAIYGKTRKAVSEALTHVLNEINKGIFVEPSKLTVGEYLRYWLEESVRPTIRQTTYLGYEVNVRVHLIPELGKVLLQQLTAQQVEMYRNLKLKSKAPRTVAYQLTTLDAALQQAVEWGFVVRNVAALVDKPRVPRYNGARLTIEQAQTLLEALRGDRMEAAYIIDFALGLRRGELLGLHWADVDMERGTLTVRTTLNRIDGALVMREPKTEKGRRTLRIPTFALVALQAHRARQDDERERAGVRWQEHDLVFPTSIGTPYEPRNFNRHLDALLKRTGMERIRVHDIRHSAASMMEDQGVSLKTLSTILGHSTIGITADLYVHPYDGAMERAAETMDNLFDRNNRNK